MAPIPGLILDDQQRHFVFSSLGSDAVRGLDYPTWKLGRVIRAYGWQHGQALREMALEQARQQGFPNRPSRLDAAFVMPTEQEARDFRRLINGFSQHILYRVQLVDSEASSHLTDSRLCAPQGSIRPSWADVYWMDIDTQAAAIPGIDWAAATGGLQLREMLTLSQLRIEERLD